MVERLFFALWPPESQREVLAQACEGLPGVPGRWTRPPDLHLTLVFVGAVDAHLFGCVAAAGDDIALEPFELRLERICGWSKQALWVAEIAKAPSALLHLVSQLQQNLLVCGLEPEKRPYRPHLTLARKAPPIMPTPLNLPSHLHWRVNDFVLVASRPRQGASYQVLRRWSLGD
jgi:2'-5' RNA ligase